MKIRLLIFTFLFLFSFQSKAGNGFFDINKSDSLLTPAIHKLSEDSILENLKYDSTYISSKVISIILPDSLEYAPEKEQFNVHYLAFLSNPLFGELVYMGKDINVQRENPEFSTLYFGEEAKPLIYGIPRYFYPNPLDNLIQLRKNAIDTVFAHNFTLFKTTYRDLPKIDWNKNEVIDPFDEPMIIVQSPTIEQAMDKRLIRKKKISPWKGRLDGAIQFSQHAVTDNWYKGGYNYLSFLTIFSGSLNYDNNKKMKWDNSFEWREGINTLPDDTIRSYMPSEDIFKIISKFNVKATGNFYYSGNAELHTQFFVNPAAINSYELKARLFTPVTINLGIGMDYQYNFLSVAVSPVAFKYIYLSDTTKTRKGEFIDPNIFGIEAGENYRKDFGSEIKIIMKDYLPFPELKLNSTLRFFTNYKSVIFDWEIIAELRINRFLSTRLQLNPRYDNSVILEEGEKARIQMKEMITFGISYRIL